MHFLTLRLKREISFIFLILVVFILLIHTITVSAEVVLDGTLGPAQTLSGPDFEITAGLGQQVGGNLFHSFDAFNLNKGETATFLGPTSVENIISRVTGGQQSIINGQLIAKIPQANLYLINPYGFIFGPHAKLDLQGSFHLSTASFLRLGEFGSFETHQPEQSVLVSAPPSAFGFLDNPATIEIKGSQLGTLEGQTLSILGGQEVRIEQGWLRADSGRINLAAVAAANQLEMQPNGIVLQKDWGLGDITLEESTIDVGKLGEGDIYIRGGKFFVDNSKIIAYPDVGTKTSVIDIHVDELLMQNGAIIDSSTSGASPGGQIAIKVDGDAILTDSSVRTTSTSTYDDAGNAGNITLQVRCLNLENSVIGSATGGPGHGGDITLEASENINLIGTQDFPSVIQASSQGTDGIAGDAGRIFITAKNLTLSGFNTQIDNSTLGSGQGGSIRFQLENHLGLSHQAFISADSKGTGNAGNIYLYTSTIDMNQSKISTAADQANGGNILINAYRQINLEQSEISATVSGGKGHGGNLAISNPRFFRLSDSQVIANADAGRGGVVLIVTGTRLESQNGLITASSETGIDGEVKIDSIYHVDIDSLPVDFLNATDSIEKQCATRTDTEYSSFQIVGRKGLPNAPDDLQSYIVLPEINSIDND
jgi:filamentous hemagglutinin family protein